MDSEMSIIETFSEFRNFGERLDMDQCHEVKQSEKDCGFWYITTITAYRDWDRA